MPKKILVVDDDQEVASSLKTYFEAAGYDVATSFDGRGALEIIEGEGHPNLLILELYIPSDKGPLLVRSIMEASKTRGIVVLMLSSQDRSGDQFSSYQLGAQGYFGKPVKPSRVLELVEKRIGGSCP